ncbi:hypothetical protein GND98_012715 [Clostridium butyricum]|uniref:Uncharacterized protein n=1 Tax=Clostridium butyricum TaxID=1492 RepID=A0A6L9EQ09_CLOBU|nr:hypothetical protein [Clostridium butyricum]
MDLLDSVVKLDNEEENRKADYSIWGFLYQFDLTLLDILKNNTENDIFEDGKKDADTIYQIEVVEDYIKTYTINDKDYIRLAQVKYTSTSNSFSKWEVIVDLYYNYLKIKNDCNAEIDYKCYILFNAESEIKIERNEILENGRKQIGNFLKAIELSVDEDIEEKNVLAKKIKENRKRIIN